MTKELLKRINELARKSKAEGLTDEEKDEQAKLRREYIELFRRSTIASLESITLVDENGNKRKLHRKEEK